MVSGKRKALRDTLKRLRPGDEERAAMHRQIEHTLLTRSHSIRQPQFPGFSRQDIECLFHAYDDIFFHGLLKTTLASTPLQFRLSSRMTRAGAKTGAWRPRSGGPIERFEIAVSSTLILETFAAPIADRTVRVTGLECHSRLEALMRVMEHEIVHLAELLGWETSSCRQERFQILAWQIFGHTDHRHALITPREQAASAGIGPGSRVQFAFRGQQLHGIVNRITRRATVLVPCADGQQYSDGATYQKYYVALQDLQPMTGSDDASPR